MTVFGATLLGRQAGFYNFLTDTVAAVVIATLEKYKALLAEFRYGKNVA